MKKSKGLRYVKGTAPSFHLFILRGDLSDENFPVQDTAELWEWRKLLKDDGLEQGVHYVVQVLQ